MKLKILYDNNSKNGFKKAWGFSCLVEISREKILFDTGWDGNILLYNMKIAKVNPAKINKIVISHFHWDHIGGLNHILNYTNKTEVYILESTPKNLKKEIMRYTDIIEVSLPQKICDNVWTTGILGDKTKEQSMIIHTKKGNIVLTGCAHPGLKLILDRSKKFGDIYGVIGGFHDSKTENLEKIPLIIPCHCTENIENIKEICSKYRECFAGCQFEI